MPKANLAAATQRPMSRRATAQGAGMKRFAKMTFEAWPEAVTAIGSGQSWAALMQEKALPLVLGLHTLKFNDVELTGRLKSGDEDSLEAALGLATWLSQQAVSFRALAEFCETAAMRLNCVLLRIGLEQEAGAAVQS